MKMTNDMTAASPKTKRRVRYEWELEAQALDCVFAAHHTGEFKLLMEACVYSDRRYDHLPQYRQIALEAYVRGALDFAARALGRAVSQPPDAVTLRPTIIPPPRKTPRANKTPTMPGWVGPSGVSYPAGVWDLVPKAAHTLKATTARRGRTPGPPTTPDTTPE